MLGFSVLLWIRFRILGRKHPGLGRLPALGGIEEAEAAVRTWRVQSFVDLAAIIDLIQAH